VSWFDPDRWWNLVEPKLDDGRLLPYLIATALGGGLLIALASEIGVRYFNTDWHYVAGYSTQPNRGWSTFVALWIVAAAAPLALGAVSASLLKLYSLPRRWLHATAVAVVGSIPVYAAGVTLILLPGILIVVVALLVSCGWWGSGSRRFLGIGYTDSAEYVAASLAVTGALLVLLSAAIPL
jgi:hypothetical protein